MGNPFFRFKQFTIFQNDNVLKVSTDSVLLGSWVPSDYYTKILDIGTGTGLLSLMLAQRFPKANIDAVEIDLEACRIAKENFHLSPFTKRINLYCNSIQYFAKNIYKKQPYDLIISNPPYFNQSTTAKTVKKNIQKHNFFLSYDTLAKIAKTLLSDNGILALIFSYESGKNFVTTARFYNLFCYKITEVYIRQGQTQPKRLLLLFSKTVQNTITNKLYLENEKQQPSTEYLQLTKAFYL